MGQTYSSQMQGGQSNTNQLNNPPPNLCDGIGHPVKIGQNWHCCK